MSELAAVRMSEEDLAALGENVDRMLAEIDDESTFMALNLEFHELVARASGNALFAYMIEALTDILDGTAIGVEYPKPRRLGIHDAHRRIYEALRSRDPAVASEAMREHLSEYAQYIARKYPAIADAPIRWT